ncbi:MAG: hypothetical protein GY799_01300 [Desulfobulbaceae bacterium]|nr:hypothetical protein [Desulfobulbaceae bacterium]
MKNGAKRAKSLLNSARWLTIQGMDNDSKTKRLLSNLIENTQHRGYKDMLADLKTRISAFELQSYSDLADSLFTAYEKLQDYSDDFNINDKDAYGILGLLLKPGHGPEIIRRLFCIQELITMITYTTPNALPELRSLVDQIINNLRFAICETGLRISSEYTPMSYAARAWDCLVHLNKMSHYERSSLMKLTDQKTPDQKTAFKASEKLTDKYEKWASCYIMTYPYNDESTWFYESVILNESNQNLYHQIMNYLLCVEDIDSIDKISRIHGELRDMIRNIQNDSKSNWSCPRKLVHI